MTNANAAENTNTAAPEAKAPSKMELARPIFKEIYAAGYKLSEGCKSQRAEFIKRAQAEIGMTAKGAATYFQNLSNEAKGESLYKYNTTKKADVAGSEETTGEVAKQAIEAADANKGPEEVKDDLVIDEASNKGPAEVKNDELTTEIGQHRWMVVNATGEEINSFSSRAKAQAAAKELGLDWQDRNDAE